MTDSERPARILIKKYANRRLYDITNSRYVNLRDIASLIKDGNMVEVVDATTGEDISKIILAQIIMEEEKGQRNLLPIEFLHQIIKSGEDTYAEVAEKMIAPGLEAYKIAQEQMETAMTQWLKPWVEVAKPRQTGEIDRLKERIAELEAALAESSKSKTSRKKK